jgi:hypothetical protein
MLQPWLARRKLASFVERLRKVRLTIAGQGLFTAARRCILPWPRRVGVDSSTTQPQDETQTKRTEHGGNVRILVR